MKKEFSKSDIVGEKHEIKIWLCPNCLKDEIEIKIYKIEKLKKNVVLLHTSAVTSVIFLTKGKILVLA